LVGLRNAFSQTSAVDLFGHGHDVHDATTATLKCIPEMTMCCADEVQEKLNINQVLCVSLVIMLLGLDFAGVPVDLRAAHCMCCSCCSRSQQLLSACFWHMSQLSLTFHFSSQTVIIVL